MAANQFDILNNTITKAAADRGAFSSSLPSLAGTTGPGIVRILMGAEKYDGWIVLETVLCTIAVMHIPINDEHPLQSILFLNIACGDRHIIKKTEAHRPACLGMMSGRPHCTEYMVDLPVPNGIDAGQRAARSEIRRVQRTG